MNLWVGRSALLMAASGFVLIALRLTDVGGQLSSFCDFTRSCADMVLWSLPLQLAAFGMLLPSISIATALQRGGAGPRMVRGAATACAVLGVVAFLIFVVASFDSAWATYAEPARLDAAPRGPLLPPQVLMATAPLWPLFIGAGLELTSVQLLSLGVPRLLVGLGVVDGLALVASVSFARDPVVAQYALPAEFVLALVWACWLGISLIVRGRHAVPAPA